MVFYTKHYSKPSYCYQEYDNHSFNGYINFNFFHIVCS